MYPFQQDTFCRSKCLKFISCRCNSCFLWLDTRFEMYQQISRGEHEIQPVFTKCKHDKFSLLCFKSQVLHRKATLSEPRASQPPKQRTNFCKQECVPSWHPLHRTPFMEPPHIAAPRMAPPKDDTPKDGTRQGQLPP